MLLVRTVLKSSPIQGFGLFADEDIPAGKKIWTFQSPFDVVFSLEQLDRLTPETRDYVFRYGYLCLHMNAFVLCGDNNRYINHSDNANCTDEDPEFTVTRQDVKAGEELTCNYHQFMNFNSFWRTHAAKHLEFLLAQPGA